MTSLEDEWVEAPSHDLDMSDDEEVEDERKHDKLLDAISSLDGKKRGQIRQRSEIAGEVSEYHVGSGTDKVSLGDLLGAFGNKLSSTSLKKQLNRVQHNQKVLETPLSKNEQDRITRTLAYDENKKNVAIWDPVVEKNRKAEHLSFPLQKPDLRLITTDKFVKRFQARTPLEVEVAALLAGSNYSKLENKALTKAEEKALKAMSLEEARERRAELQKHRAVQSYQEAKARRLKKIKSKKYHRILRKEKEKNEKKAMEELQHTDPEAYLSKVQGIDKDRIQERMSLKHRGASKQMKKQAIFGKYDDNARQMVQDMLQKSRELTQKMVKEDESSDEEERDVADEMLTELPAEGSLNPWMTAQTHRKAYSKPVAILKEDTLEESNTIDQLESKAEDISEESNTIDHVQSKPETMLQLDVVQNEDDIMQNDNNEGQEKISKELTKITKVCMTETVNSKNEKNISAVADTEILADKKDQKKKRKRSGAKLVITSPVKDTSDNNVKANEDDVSTEKIITTNMNIDEIFESVSKKSMQKEKDQKKGAKTKSKSKQSFKQNKKSEKPKKEEVKESESDLDSDDSDDETKPNQNVIEYDLRNFGRSMISTSLTRKKTLEDFESNDWSDKEDEEKETIKVGGVSPQKNTSTSKKEIKVNPNKFMTVEKTLHSRMKPDVIQDDGDNVDAEAAEEEHRMTLAEAFASDDVIDEFRAEKKERIEKDKPKDVCLALPGWGDWGGEGLQISKKKRKRFTIKAPPAPPRKDRGLNDVIISEKKDTLISKHQVNQLPFPYKNIHQFESTMRQPIGKTWNPETAYRKLIQPKISTAQGTIIDPISKEATFKNLKRKGGTLEGGKDAKISKNNNESKKGKNKNKMHHKK